MATSANFGNMLSMAGASIFLSFLPLLPKQVLLTNFLSDLPEMSLAWDHVDADAVHRPVKWDHKMIHWFMVLFGLLSSIADCATFVVLLFWLKADHAHFRSAWLIESVVSATLVVLVIRTRHSVFRSKPAKLLICAVVSVVIATPLLAYTPLGPLFGLIPIPLIFYGYLSVIVIGYLGSVEIAKRLFIRSHKNY
jgi:Mg2+-importing ATPase